MILWSDETKWYVDDKKLFFILFILIFYLGKFFFEFLTELVK